MNIEDLPPHYRKQALEKLGLQKTTAKQSKMKNVPTEVNGIQFDSKHEAQRFQKLKLLHEAGEIQGLRLQQEFMLIPAYTTPDGAHIRGEKYIADFTYWQDGKFIVEDAKGHRTKEYIIKRKQMQDTHGITVREV